MEERNETMPDTVSRYVVRDAEELKLHQDRCRRVLTEMAKLNPYKHNPPIYLADSLYNALLVKGELEFEYVTDQTGDKAMMIGHGKDENLTIFWLLSNRAGDGVRLLSSAKSRYSCIKLTALAHGFRVNEGKEQQARLIKYYKTLGFEEMPADPDNNGAPLMWTRDKDKPATE